MFAVAAFSAFAEEFCGIIDSPITWTEAGSPYYITGDIQISHAARLTIDSGAVVYIVPGESCGETKQLDWSDSTGISIKAYGTLVIKGTAAKPVRILPAEHVPGKIQWDGIRLPYRDRSTVHIEYLHIMGASKAINASFSRFNLGNTLFESNGTGIWLDNEGDLSVFNCIFTKNLSAGIYIKNSRPSIAANIFYKNSGFGIWSDSRPSPRIRNNIFFGNADTDCRFCPVGVSTSKDTKDKFGNIYTDPIFKGSEAEEIMIKKDPNLPTPINEVKDQDLQKIYKESKSAPPKPQASPLDSLPYRLSTYSPGLNAAPKTSFFKNEKGNYDIGLYGGTPDRHNSSISF
ncbi:MAG: right-handed parallel beta-helix repeat-containing protein [Candidatus Fibromonas sp.]|jgi:parallel beta-helix repeat protein|nr:right-handed parallel beta-helix repeat-containing protein [Candidatus Fibromonas sp.]